MRPIVLIQSPDALHEEYERALETEASKLYWFARPDAALAGRVVDDPTAVVVDLDTLTDLAEVESLQEAFPQSDFVALSAVDTAQSALQCLKAGFTDFLLKPVSPEELVWSLRQSRERRALLDSMRDGNAGLLQTLSHLSSSTSPSLVRVSALQYLRRELGAQGAAWKEGEKTLASLPKDSIGTTPKVVAVGPAIAWGVPDKVGRTKMQNARTVLHHAELCLANLVKLADIRKRTFIDDLTGLFNSRYLKFALGQSIQAHQRTGIVFSVLFIDIDFFKSVNDKHGHLVGSEFLVAIGKTVKHAVRQVDRVFRYGGDEFVVILEGMGRREAGEVAERIRSRIEKRVYTITDQKVQTTVSIGFAAYPEHASKVDTLLQLADDALYAAKKESRNVVKLASVVAKDPEVEI